MNELKPEDVMPEGAVIDALELRAPHDAVCRYALALLREKDALIEDYRQELGRARVALNDANAEIERLTTLAELGKMRANDYRAMREKAKSARAEAITEFAERLKRFYSHLGGKTVGGSVEYHIEQVKNELLKEEHVDV